MFTSIRSNGYIYIYIYREREREREKERERVRDRKIDRQRDRKGRFDKMMKNKWKREYTKTQTTNSV